jgi:mannitol-1-phosphate/altronate dehydrogenase
MERRFKFKGGVGFKAFAFTVSLCDAISNGGAEMKRAIRNFESSNSKARLIKSIQNLFHVMLDREIGAV